jgi:glutathione peroxidase-family protein
MPDEKVNIFVKNNYKKYYLIFTTLSQAGAGLCPVFALLLQIKAAVNDAA